MKNIFRFMKGHGLTITAIVLLLILQAYCDLALPNYTSDVLNVGLQQNGIEDAVPETIREATLEDLAMFMPDADVEIVEDAYAEADTDGVRTLKAEADRADRETLQNCLTTPECILFQMQAMGDQMPFSLSDIRMAIGAGMMTKEQFLAQMQEKVSEYGDLSEVYLKQIAVSFVGSEYQAQGLELSKIQNRYLLKVGFKMLMMALLMSVSAIAIGYLASRMSAKIGMNLRKQIYEKVMKFTSAEMERFSTASLITRSTNDIQQVQFVTVMLLRMVAYAPILAIFGIVRVVQTRSGMSWIIVLAVVVLSSLVGILVAIAMPKFRQMQTLVDRLNLMARELLTGIMPIRAFHRELHEEKRFEGANNDLYSTQLFTNRTMAFMMPIMMFVMNGISVLIVWVGAKKVDLGNIQVGDLTAFITYSMVIVMGFLMISMVAIMLPRAGIAADRIAEVLATDISLQDPESPMDEAIAGGENVRGEVRFEDVTFYYPEAQSPALEHITFTAEPGKTTAIIGSTGCGKTTLISLIPRFFDVSEGRITLDGVDIRHISQHMLRSKIGYVPQKGMLFSGTIASNIKYADENISDEQMKLAADIAQATEFISEKEEGYDSAIAQEGSNVSGGQRQRLSIARAIAKNPLVYVFDDSFSALDYKTDKTLRAELAKHTKNAAVIIVAQRIATILHADKILCMEDGRIVGEGTHEELLKNCQTYLEIAKSQLSEEELGLGKKDAEKMGGEF